jgi:hypothetical protein
LFSSSALVAQEAKEDTSELWNYGGAGSVTFSQVALKNWAAGGESSYSLNSMVNLFAKYKKDRISWDNTLDLGYGIIKQEGRSTRKTDDKLDLNSKFGYKTSSDWYYSGALSFKSQFAKGFKYNEDNDSRSLISDFMSPAYLILSLGMDYKPGDNFNMLISPVTDKSTIVMDDSLSNAGAFGVEEGKNIRNEFGGYVKISFVKDILENVTLNTKLELFSNYLEEPENVDVNWEVLVTMKINEYLSANINTTLIYDDNIQYVDKDGVAHGPRVQFKEVFGVGLSYKF